jgi:hypothetical protein
MLAGAVVLIAWHSIQDSLIAKRENLRTVEGIDNKSNTGLWIFLLVTGLPVTIVGYLLLLRREAGPPPLPGSA